MATQDEPVNDPLVSRETEVFKAELLATVGHELRGPLTAIKGYATSLLRHERRISREERHEFLLAIVAASDRLEHRSKIHIESASPKNQAPEKCM